MPEKTPRRELTEKKVKTRSFRKQSPEEVLERLGRLILGVPAERKQTALYPCVCGFVPLSKGLEITHRKNCKAWQSRPNPTELKVWRSMRIHPGLRGSETRLFKAEYSLELAAVLFKALRSRYPLGFLRLHPETTLTHWTDPWIQSPQSRYKTQTKYTPVHRGPGRPKRS